MTPLLTIGGVLLVVALAWKLYQLWLAPGDLALRAVSLCLFLATLAYPLQLHVSGIENAIDELLGPGMARLLQSLLQMVAFYLIMVFFIFSAGQPWRRARRELVVLVAAMMVTTVAMLRTPISVRAHEFSTADMTSAAVAVFYLGAAAYFAYSLGTAARWAWRYAREARPFDAHLAFGLRLVSLGLGIEVLVLAARMVFIAVRVSGGSMPEVLAGLTGELIGLGILLWLAGLTYPGIKTRVAAIRRWARHRRWHEQLRPLWAELHDAYPGDRLHRMPTGRLGDLLALRQVHRRYYRRVIECRDGLVRLSPYLALVGALDQESVAEQARGLRAALAMRARGEDAQDTPARVLAPVRGGLDEDVAELVRLSTALRTG